MSGRTDSKCVRGVVFRRVREAMQSSGFAILSLSFYVRRGFDLSFHLLRLYVAEGYTGFAWASVEGHSWMECVYLSCTALHFNSL